MITNSIFFSQGTYGCVVNPPIHCSSKNKSFLKKKMVSKIVKNDFFTQNELKIGKIIDNVLQKKNYSSLRDFFIIYTDFCVLGKKDLISKNNKLLIDKCNLINKKNIHDGKFIALYGPYIESITLSIYLKYNPSFKKILRFYSFSLHVCRTLKKINVIHFDLKENNFLVSETKNEISKFYVIDFGFSLEYNKCFLEKSKLNYDYLKHFFIYQPNYLYWSIDHHILSYLVSNMKLNKESIFNKDILKKIINKSYDHDIYNNNVLFINITNYKKDCFEYFSRILLKESMTNQERILFLLSNYSKTWDIYSICIICIKNLLRSKLLDKDNEVFTKLLLNGIHYDYEKRPSLKTHMVQFYDFIKNN